MSSGPAQASEEGRDMGGKEGARERSAARVTVDDNGKEGRAPKRDRGGQASAAPPRSQDGPEGGCRDRPGRRRGEGRAPPAAAPHPWSHRLQAGRTDAGGGRRPPQRPKAEWQQVNAPPTPPRCTTAPGLRRPRHVGRRPPPPPPPRSMAAAQGRTSELRRRHGRQQRRRDAPLPTPS